MNHKSKRIINILLVICILITSFVGSAYATRFVFSDSVGHWAEDAINNLARKGVIHGYPDGLSVPDSISLEKMSEIFEVSIAKLLDSTEDVNAKLNQKDVLEQLAIFNEQNAEKQRTKNRIKKGCRRLGIVVIGALVILWLSLFSIDIIRLKGNEDISKRPIVTTYSEGYAPEYMYYESIGYTVYYNLIGDAQFVSGEIRVLGIPLIIWE